jgi:hypothetical protein
MLYDGYKEIKMSNKEVNLEDNIELLVNTLVGSGGDIPLTAERLCTKLGVQYGAITEYDITDAISSFDNETSDGINRRLRTMLAFKLFALIEVLNVELLSKMDKLRPSELARAHSSVVNSFATLTQGAAKVTFDFDHEAEKLADEFGVTPDEIKKEVKSMKRIVETGFGAQRE